jgi:hypothetical protein
MSNTLKLLHDEMVIAEPTFPATKEILWKIEPDTGLMSLYCENGYLDPNVKLYFNWVLLTESIFQAFQVEDTKFRIYIKDLKHNRTNYGGGGVIMKQEYTTTSLISKLDKIVIETNSVPVNPELLGTSTNEIRQVITDFDAASFIRDNLAIQFFPQGPIRYYQMNSNYPMYRIDLVVKWEDIYGNLYPLFLQDEAQVSIKLHFRKRGGDVMLTALDNADEDRR